jgi:hypothetical protein
MYATRKGCLVTSISRLRDQKTCVSFEDCVCGMSIRIQQAQHSTQKGKYYISILIKKTR